MATKVALTSSLGTHLPVLPKSSPFSPLVQDFGPRKRMVRKFKIHAELGGGDKELKPKGKKKFITKEEEPAQSALCIGKQQEKGKERIP